MPHPVLIPVGIGVGLLGAVAVGLRVKATMKKPDPVLVQQIATGVANGTVKLSTNGVPFQAIPSGPPPDPSVVVQGLTDKTTGLIGILPTDLITVNSSLVAGVIQPGATSVPGFAANENIIMQVVSAGQQGNMAPDPASGTISPGSTGPIIANSIDPKLVLSAAIQIPLTAITGVQPNDATTVEKAAAAAAAAKP